MAAIIKEGYKKGLFLEMSLLRKWSNLCDEADGMIYVFKRPQLATEYKLDKDILLVIDRNRGGQGSIYYRSVLDSYFP